MPLLSISPAVTNALAARTPVVALESTIITHGMPHPANLDTARAAEREVAAAGAVPATIAILDGRLRVGLDDAALERLATTGGAGKASRRDVAALVARGATAGTTVAATMLIAAMAGIPIFATGGIGGVHRGAEVTMDVSADLAELASTAVTVVCAGAKSILDIPKTLEYLETQGVPVIGFGTDDFPAFFTRISGRGVDYRLDTPQAVAAVMAAHRALGLRGGILVANPIPEADALPAAELDAHVDAGCREAAARGISGKALTPFLLAWVNDRTAGRSLAANIALIRNNARLAGEIAVALAGLDRA